MTENIPFSAETMWCSHSPGHKHSQGQPWYVCTHRVYSYTEYMVSYTNCKLVWVAISIGNHMLLSAIRE